MICSECRKRPADFTVSFLGAGTPAPTYNLCVYCFASLAIDTLATVRTFAAEASDYLNKQRKEALRRELRKRPLKPNRTPQESW